MEDVAYYMDGDMWCAVLPDFIDLAVSPAGFGLTQEDALSDLAENLLK